MGSDTAPRASRPWLGDVERATGLAIALVVVGHLHTGSLPAGAQWYESLKSILYTFHMPFFMFLSGLIMGYSYRPVTGASQWRRFVLAKGERLLFPLLLFGVTIIVGKQIFADFIYIDNVHSGFLDSMRSLMIYPDRSPAGSLWYVYVLFQFYLLFTAIRTVSGTTRAWLPVAALAVYPLQPGHLFMANSLCEFAFFFAFGMFAADHYERWVRLIDRFRIACIAVFVVALSFVPAVFDERTSKLIVGAASIPALHALVRGSLFEKSSVLELLGRYSFAIYLMNTIAIGLVKGLAITALGLTGLVFTAMAPVAIAAGIVLPILVKSRLFVHVPWLDRLTD
jgi:fucose 4-O-acetylase-like acetyltransferase